MKYENENIEYKTQITPDIYKEVVAFANSEGGIIYIGIDDNGNNVGIDSVDDTYTRLTNGIRDNIVPDVTMFIRYQLQDNKVICIEVAEGSFKPYYLKAKGMKSSGVYVRQGASSVQASSENIRKMIKESDGDVYEEKRSLLQELSFDTAIQAFKKYNVIFHYEKYLSLGLINNQSNQYTNLALLLSDQCQHTTKIAVFRDDDNLLFQDSKEFTGSIFKQLDDSYRYLLLSNHKISRINGLERNDYYDYPSEAIREALLNALIHRDYSFSGSIIINVNDSCMEFISIGGLLKGLTSEDIKNGISQCRNQNLANIFYRLRLIESYGTGIRKIFALYKHCKEKPRINVTPNTFKIILPNMNYYADENHVLDNKQNENTNISQQMQMVLDYLREYNEINEIELQELLRIKKTRAYLLARKMNECGLIDIVGRGTSKKYILHQTKEK